MRDSLRYPVCEGVAGILCRPPHSNAPARHAESPRECREALDCGGSTPLLARTGGRERSVECGAALDGHGHSTLLLRAKGKRRRAAAVQRLSPRSTAPAHPRLAKLRIPEQKAGVKDVQPAKPRSSLANTGWCLLAILFVGSCYGIWRVYDYQDAVREAKKAGFDWECVDTLSLIQENWENALIKETWGPHTRTLVTREGVSNLSRYRELLHRLRPTKLIVDEYKDENVDFLDDLTSLQSIGFSDSNSLQNVDALKGLTSLQSLKLGGCRPLQDVNALKNLTRLQTLELIGCSALQNVDALKNLTRLKSLDLRGCTALQNVDGLKGLTSLQSLDLHRCLALKNVDGLKGLTGIKSLDLSNCIALQNVNGLKGITSLKSLDLYNCTALQNVDSLKENTKLQELGLRFCAEMQNVDSLKGLTALQALDLHGCNKIPANALRELHTALPKTDIIFPDGTKNPPQ